MFHFWLFFSERVFLGCVPGKEGVDGRSQFPLEITYHAIRGCIHLILHIQLMNTVTYLQCIWIQLIISHYILRAKYIIAKADGPKTAV